MKRTLNLRTGTPVWNAYRTNKIPTKKLTQDIKTDVLVVGMGISGAMMAEALTAKGINVVCVDRRGPMLGSTPATTALVQFEIDTPLTRLSQSIGREKAVSAWQRSRLAVSNLRDRIRDLDIQCTADDRPSLYLAGNVMSPTELKEEARARVAAGLRSRYMTASELKAEFGIERDAALVSHGNMALDPRKLTAGMLSAAGRRSARFYDDVEVGAIESTAQTVTVQTKGGACIECAYVVLATGYEMHEIIPKLRHKIISTWAMATPPQPRSLWPQAALIWEASDPYLYLRATRDGRVICGGEDEDFSDEEKRDAMLDEKIATIRAKLARLMPEIDTTADYAWAGSFGSTETGLPYIGAIPRNPRIFTVMGYGGNGITYSQLASEMITSAIEGTADDSKDLFSLKNGMASDR